MKRMKYGLTSLVLALSLMLPLVGEARHVVFIHGLNSEAALWKKMADQLVDMKVVESQNVLSIDYSGKTSLIGTDGLGGVAFEAAHHVLMNLGLVGVGPIGVGPIGSAIVSAFGSSIGYNAPIEDLAKHCANQTKTFMKLRDATQVDFVVHSMGGLILRSMVAQGLIKPSEVGRVVTLATPHYGQDNIALATQVKQMNYGSTFMWDLANADAGFPKSRTLCVVGDEDKIVDNYAAVFNGVPYVKYVDRSHSGTPLIEHKPGICECSGGYTDPAFAQVYGFLLNGRPMSGGDKSSHVGRGGSLMQVIDGRGCPVAYANEKIVTEAKSDFFTYGDTLTGINKLTTYSPGKSPASGIFSLANEYRELLVKHGGILPGAYHFSFNASKDNAFMPFTTTGAYEIVDGRTTVAQIPAENTRPLDFVFLIDSTGSMGGSIESVKNHARQLIREQLFSGTRQTRVAVVDYRDFPAYPYGNSGDWTFKLRCPFTSDPLQAIASLDPITANGGADAPESLYAALAKCIKDYGLALGDGGWRANAAKAIMVMTDAAPHDPEPFTGYTLAKIKTMMNTMVYEAGGDYPEIETIGGLALTAAKAGESGSVGGVSIYPVLTYDTSHSLYSSLATETGGTLMMASDFANVAAAVSKVIEQTMAANGFEHDTVAVNKTAGSVTLRVYGGNTSLPASLGYRVVAGTASAGTDYQADGEVHRLTWAAGERSYKSVTVPIIADAGNVTDRFFSVILCDGENMGLGGVNVCRVNITSDGLTVTGIPSDKVFVRAMTRQTACGSVSGSGLYPVGNAVTLTATAAKNYVFTSWDDGDLNPVRSINTTEARASSEDGIKTYLASFKPLSELSAPSIVSYENAFAYAGKPVYWELDFHSETLAQVTCGNLPPGLVFADGAVAGTPTAVGSYPVTFTVSNPAGSASATVTFVVTRTTRTCRQPETMGSFDAICTTAASVFDGYLQDADGVFAGTIQVKAAKAKADRKTGALTSKVTARVQLLDGGKLSFAKGIAGADGKVSPMTSGNWQATLTLGKDGFSGTVTDGTTSYSLDGARNVFSAKDAEGKAAAEAAMSRWAGSYAMVWNGTLAAVSVGSKGKAKATLILPMGQKATVTAQLIVGDDGIGCVPVLSASAHAAFLLWLDEPIAVAGANGLSDLGAASVARTGSVLGATVDYGRLPDGYSRFADPKSEKLKLRLTPKTGLIRGSFKVAQEVNGRVKPVTVTVVGVQVGDLGFCHASIRGLPAWLLTVSP